MLRLKHRGFRDLVGFAHPPSNLLDRGRQLLGCGGDRLHVAGGLFRRAGDLARQALRGFRGPRQRSGGGFELNGGRRNIRHNGAHRRLEFVGEANELGAPRRAARLVLGLLGCRVALGLGDRLHLEFFHRARHLAELVLAAKARQHDVKIAAGEFTHRLAHRRHRAGNSLAEQQRQRSTEQEAARRKHHNQALDLADGLVRLGFEFLLIGNEVRIHCACTLDDRSRGVGHLGNQLIDFLRILDQFVERLPIFSEQRGGFLETLADLFIGRRDRLQRVLDEFESRQRAGRDRLVCIDDEGIDQRRHRLKLIGHFLGAELDRLELRIVCIAGQVVELVTQRVGAARQLILRHQGAVALDLDNVGENLGEGTKFTDQARDLIEPRRICGALHRLIDGVLQTGFGGQRRLGIVFFSGDHVISRQSPVRNQLAVDVAGQIGLRHAVAEGCHAGGYALEPEIGDAHADRRDSEHDGKAEHDFSAESQGRKLWGYRFRPHAF